LPSNTLWNEREEQILKENYFEKGSFATQDILIEEGFKRSIIAIRTRAVKLGVKTRATFRQNIRFRGDKIRHQGSSVLAEGGGAKQGSISLTGRHEDDRRAILPPKEFQKKTELYLGLPMFIWPSTPEGVGQIMRVLTLALKDKNLSEDAVKFLDSVRICMNELGSRIATASGFYTCP